MIRLLPLCFALLLCTQKAQAQQNQKQKLSNIVAAQEKEKLTRKALPTTVAKKEIKEEFEGGDYQFDRWLWWATQHTDKDGYVVSEAEAWKMLDKDMNASHAQSKTTATSQSDWSLKGITSNTGLFLNVVGNGQGRINTVEFHPTDKNTFWIGSSSGGAWKTTDFGNTWKCMTDNLPHVVAVGDITINPLNPNTIYLCTGDASGFAVGNTGGAGVGLLKSTDGGVTWKATGLSYKIADAVYTNKLIINPKDTNKIVCATNKALYQSNDGGTNWFVLFQQPTAANRVLRNVWDVKYAPGDSVTLYSSFFVVDTITQTRYTYIMKRTNGAGNFTGAISTNCVRANIAVSKNYPNDVYAVTAYTTALPLDGGRGAIERIYYSPDKLTTAYFTYYKAAGAGDGNLFGGQLDGSSKDGQGHYDMAIAIDPANINRIIVGGVNAWESTNNGASWQLFNQWRGDNFYTTPIIHADKHFVEFHPLDSTFLFECNDGGIFYQKNGAWTNITPGLSITQFYRNTVSYDGKFALGGAQDNGTHTINLINSSSHQTGWGDGMECQVDYSNPNVIYWSSQYGNIYRYNTLLPIDFTVSNKISDNIITAGGQKSGKGAWITPFLLDPLYPTTLIAGYDTVFMSIDTGHTWNPISPKLGRTNMVRLAMTPANAGTLYAVEDIDTNVVYVSHNIYTTQTWQTISHPFTKRNITDIKVDPKDKDHFWISFAGWGNTTMVAEYKNGTWKSISEDLPAEPVYCIEVDSSDGTLYIGTYDGVYYRPVDSNKWALYSTKLPRVSVYDLGIDYSSGQLVAATWGRGMWSTPKYLKELVGIKKGIPYAYKQLDIYPNPANNNFTVISDVNQFNNNNVQVSLIDVKGQVVLQQQNSFKGNKMDVSNLNLPNGVYVLRITKGGTDIKARIVISK